jgi:hypothetical protein
VADLVAAHQKQQGKVERMQQPLVVLGVAAAAAAAASTARGDSHAVAPLALSAAISAGTIVSPCRAAAAACLPVGSCALGGRSCALRQCSGCAPHMPPPPCTLAWPPCSILRHSWPSSLLSWHFSGFSRYFSGLDPGSDEASGSGDWGVPGGGGGGLTWEEAADQVRGGELYGLLLSVSRPPGLPLLSR